MALQIWLPLNNSVNNQGLANVVTSTIGTITYENGKIGKAFKVGTGTQVANGISINSNLVEELGNEYSCAVWVKPTGNHVHYEGAIISSGNWNAKCWAFGLKQDNSAVDMFGPGYNRYLTCSIPVNEWTHLVSTFKDNIGTLYKNGEYIGTYTFNQSIDTAGGLESDAANTTIGRETYASGYFGFNGSLNDIRIYDHCLSPKEVKEIAKGLVLHYPLNRDGFGLDNILKTTYTLASNWVANQGTISNGVANITPTSNSDRRIYQTPAMGSWSWQASTTYTVSVEARSNDGAKLIISPYGSGAANSSVMTVTSKWKRYSYTFTSTASPSTSSLSLNVSQTSGVTLQMRRPKMEISSVVTPWIPNSADTEYSIFGLNSTTVPDTSGYGHNADIINSPTYTADTPRYQTAIHMTATNQKLHVSNLVTSGFGNTYSIAWWGKSNTYSGTMHWGFSDGIRLNGIYNGNLWNTGDGSNNPLYKPGTTTQVTAPTVNVWHHFVMVGDGSTCKVYMDGELWGQAKTYKAISGTSIYFNGWDSSTSYCQSDLNVSDFRIYATALTADQVKQLYEAPISLANNGTLFANEFNET